MITETWLLVIAGDRGERLSIGGVVPAIRERLHARVHGAPGEKRESPSESMAGVPVSRRILTNRTCTRSDREKGQGSPARLRILRLLFLLNSTRGIADRYRCPFYPRGSLSLFVSDLNLRLVYRLAEGSPNPRRPGPWLDLCHRDLSASGNYLRFAAACSTDSLLIRGRVTHPRVVHHAVT